jgi:hypothetical protein
MSGLDQIQCHGRAHIAQTDKRDAAHDVLSPVAIAIGVKPSWY